MHTSLGFADMTPFYKLKIYGNSVVNKFIGTILPIIFAQFVCLPCFGNYKGFF